MRQEKKITKDLVAASATPLLLAILAMLGSGVLAATLGTILSWRDARSTVGTLRHVLS